MKILVTSIIAALLVLWAATEAFSAPTVRDCEVHADSIVVPMATARDQGMPPQMAMQQLMMIGFPPEIAYIITGYVYETHKGQTPERIKEIFMGDCAGDPT